MIPIAAALTVLLFASGAGAQDLTVAMNLIDERGVGKQIGTVTVVEASDGVVFRPQLTGLPPGQHGFHLHENGDCGAMERDGKMVAGLAAGGHFDPDRTSRHEGPGGKGHVGDLPALEVGPDGAASTAVAAPRLKLAQVKGKAVVIHAGGDNYADQPAPLGGGGGRIACGVIR